MSTYKFYSKYKKSKKEQVSDKNIPLLIGYLLKEMKPDDSTCSFLESLQSFYEEFNGLTVKQYNALKDIEEIFLEKYSAAYEQWKKKYDKEKRKIAVICAQYYKANPPYYTSLVDKILNDSSFIPTEKQYLSMCDNQYTRKILRETFSEPLFEKGTLAQGRKSAPDEIQEKHVTIIAVNERPVINAAKGAKPYLVLPFGSNKTVQCEERHLKKVKKLLTNII